MCAKLGSEWIYHLSTSNSYSKVVKQSHCVGGDAVYSIALTDTQLIITTVQLHIKCSSVIASVTNKWSIDPLLIITIFKPF